MTRHPARVALVCLLATSLAGSRLARGQDLFRSDFESGTICDWALVVGGPECTVAFQLTADRSGFHTNQDTPVQLQARKLPGAPVGNSGFGVVELSAPGQADVCALVDDGDLGQGDDIAGDGVFSCIATFNEPAPTEILLAVRQSGSSDNLSLALSLKSFNPLTQVQVDEILGTQAQGGQIAADNIAMMGDTLEARLATAAALRAMPEVADAGVSSDNVTVWIHHRSGVHGVLMLNPPGTRGGGGGESAATDKREDPAPSTDVEPESPQRFPVVYALGAEPSRAPAPDPDQIGNNKVMIYAPFDAEFGGTEADALEQIFLQASCGEFEVKKLKNADAEALDVLDFLDHGTILISTHGFVERDDDGVEQVAFMSGQEVVGKRVLDLDIFFQNLELLFTRYGNKEFIGVSTKFIQQLPGTLPNSVVFNSSCQSGSNASMTQAFREKGALAYFGFSEIVNNSYAIDVGEQLVRGMALEFKTAAEAYTAVSPKVDPNPPHASFLITPETSAARYSDNLRNAGFETGDQTGWTLMGDVRFLTQLGPFRPTEGQFMAVASTGLGSNFSSGTLSQTFCLPETVSTIGFNWRYFSEEFVEFCGEQWAFDDPFEVQLIHPGGTEILLRETVDSLCDEVNQTTLEFDQSGPGCTPSENVGVGTGGQDCTVWGTQWKTTVKVIDDIVAEHAGEAVTLRIRSSDAGDSIFDTAVLVDEIEISEP